KTPEEKLVGASDLLVKPMFDADREIAYLFNRRFSLYSFDDSSLGGVCTELADIFRSIPKPSNVEYALEQIDKLVPKAPNSIALHVRRNHLDADAVVQLNRFDSYCSTSSCFSLIESVPKIESILIGSDCALFVKEVRARYPGRILALFELLD